MYSATPSPVSAKITTQNKPLYSKRGPSLMLRARKTYKGWSRQGSWCSPSEWPRRSEALSSWESGHAVPFPPQDLCSQCVCILEYWNLNSRSCGLRSATLPQALEYIKLQDSSVWGPSTVRQCPQLPLEQCAIPWGIMKQGPFGAFFGLSLLLLLYKWLTASLLLPFWIICSIGYFDTQQFSWAPNRFHHFLAE